MVGAWAWALVGIAVFLTGVAMIYGVIQWRRARFEQRGKLRRERARQERRDAPDA